MARPKAPKLRLSYSNKLGSMAVQKGNNTEGNMTYSWDVGQKCQHQDCPAIVECHYEEKIEEGGICKVMRNYIRSAAVVLYESQKGISAAQRFQIGMQIMPLYRILCKLKIAEVGVINPVYHTERGSIGVHPIFKEIRETIKSIDVVWRGLGVKPKAQPITDFGKATGGNYYDAMEKAALADM